MSESLVTIVERLESIAQYDGPWRPLREAVPLLRERTAELRRRATRLDDVLVIALVGGSGVGKSTLLNALAGDQLAETSEFRPCTAVPTVYHPPGVALDFGDWRRVSGSALEHLVIIDTPDSDTIVREHRDTVLDVLAQCDLVMTCASAEKYLDEATWSLLRPLRSERTLVCVETKARVETESFREHWLARLEEQALEAAEYFRVSARTALDQRLAGHGEVDDGFDFQQLEAFLQHQLDRERIRRIKRSNVTGLLAKTLSTLHEQVGAKASELKNLEERLGACERDLAQQTMAFVRGRLFAEPHLWRFALGREVTVRAKGIVFTLFRILEAIRNAPARIAGWLPWFAKGGPAQRAAALLTDKDLFEDQGLLNPDELEPLYDSTRSTLALTLAQTGFVAQPPSAVNGAFDAFLETLTERVTAVLRGPARERIAAYARVVTGWPITLLADAPPLAFFAFFAYKTVRAFFSTTLLSATFFVHAASVLVILLLAELLLLSLVTRALAWSARRASIKALQTALAGRVGAFQPERAALDAVMEVVEQIEVLSSTVLDAEGTRISRIFQDNTNTSCPS